MTRPAYFDGPSWAVLAWLSASVVGAALGVIFFLLEGILRGGGGGSLSIIPTLLFSFWIAGAIASAPLSPALIFAIRILRMPRSWADSAGGAIVAAALPGILNAALRVTEENVAAQMLGHTVPSGLVPDWFIGSSLAARARPIRELEQYPSKWNRPSPTRGEGQIHFPAW